MSLFGGCKDDSLLWFIILFILLFWSGNNNDNCGCNQGLLGNNCCNNNCGCQNDC